MQLLTRGQKWWVGTGLGVYAASLFLLPAQASSPAPDADAQWPAIQAAAAFESPLDDEAVRQRVVNALHADPYFYDRHVTVSVEKGRIVLRGFVFSDWDLRKALLIARESAGTMPVVDNLSIKEGGR